MHAKDIRAQLIPAIATRNDIGTYVSTNQQTGLPQVSGIYAGIMKYYSNAKLVQVPNTNGQAYTISDGSNTLSNFIDPTDVPVNSTTLSQGYRLVLNTAQHGQIKFGTGWVFDSYSGILHFPSDFNPTSQDWPYGPVSGITASCFTYTGSYVNSYLAGLAQAISIQPFKFTSGDMLKGTMRVNSMGQKLMPMTIKIPAFVFQLYSVDFSQTVLAQMQHNMNPESNESGFTTITLQLPWDQVSGKPVINRQNGTTGNEYVFMAFAFVTYGGARISMKPVIQMKNISQYTDTLSTRHDMMFTVNPSTSPTFIRITTPITVNAYAQE